MFNRRKSAHINASHRKYISRKQTDRFYINTAASRNGTTAIHICRGAFSIAAPDPMPDVVYTYWKLISEELKQLSLVTSAILESPFSAKIMSTHYTKGIVLAYTNEEEQQFGCAVHRHTLYSAAPCFAVSTT